MWGPTFPELVEALPGIEIIDRSSVNAFDDPRVASAIEATGRKKLIFAGISLEVCAAFPAITAVGRGIGRLCRGRRFGNLQRDQAPGRASAHAAGRRHRLGLRDLDGGNPQGQCAAGGRRGLRSHGHGLGQASRPDRPRLRKIDDRGTPRPLHIKLRRSAGFATEIIASTARAASPLTANLP